jgi:hypothetical protein
MGQAHHRPFRDLYAQDGGEFCCTLHQLQRRQCRVPSCVGWAFYRGEVGRVFFIMGFCCVLKLILNFPCSTFAVIDLLLPQNTKQTSGVHFDKMRSRYCREALPGNLIQGGAICNPNSKSVTSLFVNGLPLRRTITTSVTQGRVLLAPYGPTPTAISI